MISRERILRLALAIAIASTASSAVAQVGFGGGVIGNPGRANAVTLDTTCYTVAGIPDGCCPTCPNGQMSTECLFNGDCRSGCDVNTIADPLLHPDYDSTSTPRWTPQANSPALLSSGGKIVDLTTIDPWFVDTSHAGALDDVANWPADDWTQEWIYTNYDGGLGRTDIPAGPGTAVTGDILSNQTWTAAGSPYVLIGRIGVGKGSNPGPAVTGVTLTIQAGTVIVGSGVGSYLVVERDNDLVVNGTRQSPVIFTSGGDYTAGDQLPGDWGGVVIHGKAVANCAVGGAIAGCNLTSSGNDCESEGGAGFFGGSDDSDDSGSIRYARVEYSGQEISPNNELNSWTMNAVGAGTTLEYLQAIFGTDDLFEWFGGVADCRYLVGQAGADDGLDWQMGYRGRLQFAVIQQVAVADGGQDADKGIEADNNEFDFDCPGRSNPRLANVTFIGADGGVNAMHLRRGTHGQVYNFVAVDWPSATLNVQHQESWNGGIIACPTLKTNVAADPFTVAAFSVNVSPNPVSSNSLFSFNLPASAEVELKIYDSRGRLVNTVRPGTMGAGLQTVAWSPQGSASGVYYYAVKAGVNSARGKLMVIQ